jgi:hypothetical protein
MNFRQGKGIPWVIFWHTGDELLHTSGLSILRGVFSSQEWGFFICAVIVYSLSHFGPPSTYHVHHITHVENASIQQHLPGSYLSNPTLTTTPNSALSVFPILNYGSQRRTTEGTGTGMRMTRTGMGTVQTGMGMRTMRRGRPQTTQSSFGP